MVMFFIDIFLEVNNLFLFILRINNYNIFGFILENIVFIYFFMIEIMYFNIIKRKMNMKL